VPNDDDEPSSYSAKLFHYNLGVKIHELLSKGGNKRHIKDYTVIQTIHDEVRALLDDLPPAMRLKNPDMSWDSRCPHLPKQRQHAFNAASAFLLALHRPHVVEHPESRHAAIEAALNCLDGQQRLFEMVQEHHYRFYSLSFVTIDAGIFLSGITIEHPPDDPLLLQRIQSALRQGIARLTVIQKRSTMAKSGLEFLRICYEKIDSPPQIDPSLFDSVESSSDHLWTPALSIQPPAISNTSTVSHPRCTNGASMDPDVNPELDSQHPISMTDVYMQATTNTLELDNDIFSATPPSWAVDMDINQFLNLDPTAHMSEWSSLLG